MTERADGPKMTITRGPAGNFGRALPRNPSGVHHTQVHFFLLFSIRVRSDVSNKIQPSPHTRTTQSSKFFFSVQVYLRV